MGVPYGTKGMGMYIKRRKNKYMSSGLLFLGEVISLSCCLHEKSEEWTQLCILNSNPNRSNFDQSSKNTECFSMLNVAVGMLNRKSKVDSALYNEIKSQKLQFYNQTST